MDGLVVCLALKEAVMAVSLLYVQVSMQQGHHQKLYLGIDRIMAKLPVEQLPGNIELFVEYWAKHELVIRWYESVTDVTKQLFNGEE